MSILHKSVERRAAQAALWRRAFARRRRILSVVILVALFLAAYLVQFGLPACLRALIGLLRGGA